MQLLEREQLVPEYCRASALILGCGNVLFGDDGFGPAVAERLRSRSLPPGVCAIDAGTGARTILFTLTLSDTRPATLIVVDAIDAGRRPGELFMLPVEDLPSRKIDDFSMHQLPTSNLLKELRDECGLAVTVVACQVERIPDSVLPGLSGAVSDAVPRACRAILDELSRE